MKKQNIGFGHILTCLSALPAFTSLTAPASPLAAGPQRKRLSTDFPNSSMQRRVSSRDGPHAERKRITM